ncbi:MAG: PTS transporter subunit EIIC [Culicoidibacterales bacterium]
MKQFFSKLGQTFMLPIALLPAAGIMLGIGGSLTSAATIKAYGWESFLGVGTPLNSFLTVVTNAGDIVFANLPVMFAIAIAIGFAKKEKGAAALASVMSYLVMNVSLATTLKVFGLVKVTEAAGKTTAVLHIFGNDFPGMLTSALGISNTLSMGVFGGMIAGGIAAALHNKYCDVKLPDFLGFFGGPRFVPIVSSFTALFVGMALVVVWPPIGVGLATVGNGLGWLSSHNLGYLASLLFGLVERSLIPFGLHHVFYLPLWQSTVGGTYHIGGADVFGTQAAFFASLASGDWKAFPATNFMSGKFPFMMFGLPAAAYAMYKCTDAENRKATGGLLFSVALTSFLTGITEPIEFTFLFLAPVLYYGFHVPIAGLSFMLMDLLGVKVGMTFSGGAIDFTMFGVFQGALGVQNNFYFIPVVGLALMPLYYFGFKWYITKFNIATPGRNGAEVKTISKAEYKAAKGEGVVATAVDAEGTTFAHQIIEGLGGRDNINDVDACITRLRVSVKDADKVQNNDFWTKEMGASGLVKNGKAIQVIYGAKAAGYKSEINEILGE